MPLSGGSARAPSRGPRRSAHQGGLPHSDVGAVCTQPGGRALAAKPMLSAALSARGVQRPPLVPARARFLHGGGQRARMRSPSAQRGRAPAPHAATHRGGPAALHQVSSSRAYDKWLYATEQAFTTCTPDVREHVRCLQGLSGLPRAAVQDRQREVEALLTRLIVRMLPARDAHMAVVVHAVSVVVKTHRCFAATVARESGLRVAVHSLVQSAAEHPETYTSERLAAQMATALLSLAVHSDTFWARLAGVDMIAFGGRELSTLVHRAVKCAATLGAPPPSDELWRALMVAVEAAAEERRLDAQAVSNCLWACAQAGPADARSADAAAAQQRCVDALASAAARGTLEYSAQAAATVWWALSALEQRPKGGQRWLLLHAVQRTAPEMCAQDVSNTLLAFARLGLPLSSLAHLTAAEEAAAGVESDAAGWWPPGEAGERARAGLVDALMWASERTVPRMSSQAVSNTFWGMGTLGLDVPDLAQGALWAAVVRTAPRMRPQEVSNTLLGAAKLRLSMPEAARAAWYAAVQRTAPGMNAQDAANIVWALAELRSGEVPEAVRACILSAVERAAPQDGLQGLQQVLEGLVALQWRTEVPLQQAWLDAARRHAPVMRASHVRTVAAALGALQWRVDAETHDALLQAADRVRLPDDMLARVRGALDPLVE